MVARALHQVLVKRVVHDRVAGQDPAHIATRIVGQHPGIVGRHFDDAPLGRHHADEPQGPFAVAGGFLHRRARFAHLLGLVEAFAIVVRNPDLVAVAEGVFVTCRDVPAFGEVGNVRHHVPGAHEAGQVHGRRSLLHLAPARAAGGQHQQQGDQGRSGDAGKQRHGHVGLLPPRHTDTLVIRMRRRC